VVVCSSLGSVSSPSSVGAKSDMVEMLNVGEESAVAGIFTKVPEEDHASPCKMEEGIPLSTPAVGRS